MRKAASIVMTAAVFSLPISVNWSADKNLSMAHSASATSIVARQIQKGLSRASRLRPMARGC
jgi:hypothetical protein